MKYTDIQELTTKELKELVSEEKERYTKMKISHAVSPLDNPMRITVSRKLIAQLKTELRKRQLSK
ncbi:MAG: 50S ribosomal protein L29 [Bacteroidetes bacterium]|jgi:large subunit ribosomal protein L29|nr:50S ribosomal protein L29 [Bacteroidota bacterium]MBT5527912.1 50S ribosomal protein L29 [Cytophagia bacterium]MBT3424929.1 50S ribosomal protein L29 [Bacteroidota bacterium]MBT4338250.1 50S ribosomal protein L29 [Bacteroidota bacterium]MBT4727788.1 50S ribosomal protein L29 [Bacteroidota bacterium]